LPAFDDVYATKMGHFRPILACHKVGCWLDGVNKADVAHVALVPNAGIRFAFHRQTCARALTGSMTWAGIHRLRGNLPMFPFDCCVRRLCGRNGIGRSYRLFEEDCCARTILNGERERANFWSFLGVSNPIEEREFDYMRATKDRGSR
jgi:hypothetical protein